MKKPSITSSKRPSVRIYIKLQLLLQLIEKADKRGLSAAQYVKHLILKDFDADA